MAPPRNALQSPSPSSSRDALRSAALTSSLDPLQSAALASPRVVVESFAAPDSAAVGAKLAPVVPLWPDGRSEAVMRWPLGGRHRRRHRPWLTLTSPIPSGDDDGGRVA